MGYFVGIDSGGTKTECWLGNEQRVLARVSCGSVKLTRVGEEAASDRLRGLLTEAAALAGIDPQEVAATCVGMSGYSIPRLRGWMEAELRRLVSGDVEVCGDEEIALDAAFRGGPGILVIAGTGSIAVGRLPDGRRVTAGGWGPALGDEGSGAWIGAEALRAAFAARDRGIESGLVMAVQQAWGAANAGEVVGLAHTQPPPDFAALTPLVVRLAEAGDAVAARVLQRAGESLAELVETVRDRMGQPEGAHTRVAYTGSVLGKGEAVRAAFLARLSEKVEVLPGAVQPCEGALWRALQPARS